MSSVGRFGRLGVVANPCAGAGPDVLRDVLGRLFRCVSGADIVVNEGTFEAAAAKTGGVVCRRVRGPQGDARRLTEAVLAAGVDTIVGIGGDGTLGEIASALVSVSPPVRLLGIGVGSSNVGPLVGASASDLGDALPGAWDEVGVHALDVRVDGGHVAIAFHDAAPANTYFGTRSGRRVDLDAAAALRGVDRVAEPSTVCGSDTWVAKNGRRLLTGDAVAGGQIVASPLNDVDECRGKAVAGFLCWGPYVGCRGLVAVASAVMIRTRLDADDLKAAEPLRLFHLGVGHGDVVDVGDLARGAVAVVDGTPRVALGPDATLSVHVIESAVVSLRRAGAWRHDGREERCSTAAS